MSVTPSDKVDAATTNAAFMSRNSNTDTIGTVDLLNENSGAIMDLQAVVNEILSSPSGGGGMPTLRDWSGTGQKDENKATSIWNLDVGEGTTSQVIVPLTLAPATELKLNVSLYCASTPAFTFNIQVTAALIRGGQLDNVDNINVDAFEVNADTGNQQTLLFSLTDVLGDIGGLTPQPNDVLKIYFDRVAVTSGTEATDPVSFIPSLTELI